jgi:beta-lactamase regulating signal transducer with metallopeptidase domain
MSPETVREIGWVLLHFLWQGTALALLLPPLWALCRTPASRYACALGVLTLMAAAPAATFLALTQSGESVPPMPGFGAGPGPIGAVGSLIALSGRGWSSWEFWLVGAWLAGITGLSLRMLGGWLLLERLRRRETVPLTAALRQRCRALQRHLALSRSVQFAASTLTAVPVVVGWFRPIVLLPLSSLSGLSPAQLDAVILHELAHIKRLDAFANLFQILVETLLFYHPAVWWVSRQVRLEREQCCDDIAVAASGNPLDYALALTLLEAARIDRRVPAAALAATGGALKQRVIRLLGQQQPAPSIRPALAILAAVLCIAASMTAGHALTSQADQASPSPPPADLAAPPSAPPAVTAETPATAHSYIGALAAAGLTNLTPDQLIALKTIGVTGDYVAAMHKAGYRPSVDELVGLRSIGVRPEDAAGFHDLGLSKVSVEDLITLHALGVTPDYIQGLQQAGLRTLSARDYGTAKATGITAEFIATLRAHGIGELDLGKLIALKSTGVF